MIKLENINKIYNRDKKNEFQALHNINLEIAKGEMTAIMGKSGAGKSTLLHILACMDSYDSGIYRLDNQIINDLSESENATIRNEKIGVILQDFSLIEDFTVYDNVVMPLDIAARKSKGKADKVLAALKQVSMDTFAKKVVGELSGGQKQRIAIARAMINNPDLILADEPTGALDSENSAAIMKLFGRLHENRKTIIIITHDHEIANQCERVIKINDGKIS